MENNLIPLCDVPAGKCAKIARMDCKGENRRRFLDLGMICSARVTPLYKSPANNPVAYMIRGAVIAIRNEDAADILTQFETE